MSALGTVMSAVSLAAYKPVREAVGSSVEVIEGDLKKAGKAISSGIDAVSREVKTDVAHVKGALETIGRTIDTFV